MMSILSLGIDTATLVSYLLDPTALNSLHSTSREFRKLPKRILDTIYQNERLVQLVCRCDRCCVKQPFDLIFLGIARLSWTCHKCFFKTPFDLDFLSMIQCNQGLFSRTCHNCNFKWVRQRCFFKPQILH